MIACGVLLIYGTGTALAAGAVVLAATLGPHLLRTDHRAGRQCVDPSGSNSAHDTSGFQSTKAPLGLSFHAQTCSS